MPPSEVRTSAAARPGARPPTVLVVEDDAALSTLLRYNLERRGFRVEEAADGPEALLRVAEAPPDLVLLDWMLPTLSGLEVCRQLRRRPDTHALPVLVLTARGEASDAVRALDAGADDHVAKPFEMEALLARIRALLRRAGVAGGAWEVGAEGGGAGAGPAAARGSSALTFADLVLDRETHRVTRGGRALRLGPTEYRLLEFLLRYPRRVFTREQLLSAVWGPGIHVGPRTVDVHVRRLRRALNAAGEPDLIRTVRTAGYALDDTPEPG